VNLPVMEAYTTKLKSMALSYPELKKGANLVLQGFNGDGIKEKALKENIFTVNTPSRIKEIAVTVMNRIKVLDDTLLEKLAHGKLETSKQVALYTLLKTDRLFFEFMYEVYREKCQLREYVITEKDFNTFFQRKSEQSEQVASWRDYTYYKLKQVYKRILVEAGYASKNKKNLQLTTPLVEQDLVDHLKSKGEQVYLEALQGEV